MEKDREDKDRKGRLAAADLFSSAVVGKERRKKEDRDNGCGLSRRLKSLEA